MLLFNLPPIRVVRFKKVTNQTLSLLSVTFVKKLVKTLLFGSRQFDINVNSAGVLASMDRNTWLGFWILGFYANIFSFCRAS